MTRLLYIVLVGVLFISASIAWIDEPLARWINENQAAWVVEIGNVLDALGKSLWLLVFSALATLLTWKNMRVRAYQFAALFAGVAISGILANIVKIVVCRPRPPLFIEQGITQWDMLGFNIEYLWNSFPSGHATTGIVIAIWGAAIQPRLRWLFWTLGISILLGRLMLNAHYLGDVLAGALLGAVVTMGILNVLRAKIAAAYQT